MVDTIWGAPAIELLEGRKEGRKGKKRKEVATALITDVDLGVLVTLCSICTINGYVWVTRCHHKRGGREVVEEMSGEGCLNNSSSVSGWNKLCTRKADGYVCADMDAAAAGVVGTKSVGVHHSFSLLLMMNLHLGLESSSTS